MKESANRILKVETNLYIEISKNRTAIMGIAIFSIMLFHQYFTKTIPFNLFHNFGYWGVDVFIFLSGMGLVNSLRKNSIKQFYINRILRLLPSCIICGTTKYLIFLALGTSALILKEGLNLGIWSIMSLDLWYIHTIIILYIFSPIFYNLLNKWPIYTILVIVPLFVINELSLRPNVGYDWFSPIGIFSWTVGRLPVFILGMYLNIKNNVSKHFYIFSIISLFLAISIKIFCKYYQSIDIQVYANLILVIGIPALILFNILLLSYMPNRLKDIFVFLGKYSLELYLVHEFIFWTIKVYFNGINPLILLSISFILSCAIAFISKQPSKFLKIFG